MGDEDFGFDVEDLKDMEGSTYVAPPPPSQEQDKAPAVKPQTDEEAFGEDFGFDEELVVETPKKPHVVLPNFVGPDGKKKIVQTSLSPKFPQASQAFPGPANAGFMLASITFTSCQMIEPGRFTCEIRDGPDGGGTCLAQTTKITASKDLQSLVVSFKEPPPLPPQRNYYVFLKLEEGLFKFELEPEYTERYRFCLDTYSKKWATTATPTSYSFLTKFARVPDADPERGDMSNWMKHTKTDHKRGTLRRLSIVNRNKVRFVVLDGTKLLVHKNVDDCIVETIDLKDVQHVASEERPGSRVLLISTKAAEHVFQTRTHDIAKRWLAELEKRHKSVGSSYGDSRATNMMF